MRLLAGFGKGTRNGPRGWWQVNRESLNRLAARNALGRSTAPTASRTASNGTPTAGKENAKNAQSASLTSV
jgi:hypothetical protein